AIFLEARIAMAYLPEHLVEAIDEGADLILRVALDPQGVVLLDGHSAHGLRQIDDGPRDLLLKPGGEPIRYQDGGNDGAEADQGGCAPVRIKCGEGDENVQVSKRR